MIDRFDKARFEAVLGIYPEFESAGLVQGEETYYIPVNSNARLQIRSSIDSTGFAAESGEDSIRIWVEVYQPNYKNPTEMIWKPCGKKFDAYTTRVKGWESRVEKKITVLWNKAARVVRPVNTCPKCQQAGWVGFSKSEKNPGRPYMSHNDCNHFEWLDKPYEKGEIIHNDTISTDVPSEELQDQVYSVALAEQGHKPLQTIENSRNSQNNGTERQGSASKVRVQGNRTGRNNRTRDLPELLEEAEEGHGDRVRTDAEQVSVRAAKDALKRAKTQQLTEEFAYGDKHPNESQQEAIEAGVDSNVRVLAPPGSGKTFTIEHRYRFLVQQGISPNNILVVTFNKKMADEMGERIAATCPMAYGDHISTIHAFCYRLLTRWDANSRFYGWQVPKDWQVKKILDSLIEKIWVVNPELDEELPGWKEVALWIDNSKHHGLDCQEARNYFIQNLGARYGEWVYQIRCQYDAQMSNQKWMTFADMLFYTEQQLKNDAKFRTKWQKQFTHVIIDESQDTSSQSIKILVTVGMEPGWNEYYDK